MKTYEPTFNIEVGMNAEHCDFAQQDFYDEALMEYFTILIEGE